MFFSLQRALVLDYLCHNCYTETARAFARDTAVRHIDKDGDEITSSDRWWQGTSVDLTEEGLRKIQLREGALIYYQVCLVNVNIPVQKYEQKSFPGE